MQGFFLGVHNIQHLFLYAYGNEEAHLWAAFVQVQVFGRLLPDTHYKWGSLEQLSTVTELR